MMIIGNTLGEIENGNLQDINFIYKEKVSPTFLLDTRSSFYFIYPLRDAFPYLPIRKIGHFFFYGFISIFLFQRGSQKRPLVNGIVAMSLSTCIGMLDDIPILLNRKKRVIYGCSG